MIRPGNTRNLPVDRTIRSSRTFSATREALWALFENPADLGAWWGPAGFTNTFQDFEFWPGGAWRFVMHGPDGSDYAMDKIFVRIQRPETIVLDHIDPVHGFRMFIELTETVGGTRMDWTMVFDHAEEVIKVRPFVEPANEQNFDRLAARLNAGRSATEL